jgi:O-antigen biosynthesis protein
MNFPLQNLSNKKFCKLGFHSIRLISSEGITSFWYKARIKMGSISPGPYQWLSLIDPGRKELKMMEKKIKSFSTRPSFTLILFMESNTPKEFTTTIQAILNQIYPEWELIIQAESSFQTEIAGIFKRFNIEDSRISIISPKQNETIFSHRNRCIQYAKGDFIGILNEGEFLTQNALFDIASYVCNISDIDLIYSDEVLIGPDEDCQIACFFPDFSLDYLLSNVNLFHFFVVKSPLIHSVEGFRKKMETSERYDLFLQLVSKSRKVVHIPKILCKIRGSNGSSPNNLDSQILISGKIAIEDFLSREGICGRVEETEYPGIFHARREIGTKEKVSIIIPTKDCLNILQTCLESIERETTYKNYEILIVDNQSKENPTKQYLNCLPQKNGRIKVISFNEPFNYSRLNNFAVTFSTGSHLLFLNNDVEVISPGWLDAMLELSVRDDIACVGAKLLYPDGLIQHAGVVVGLMGVADHIYKYSTSSEGEGYLGQLQSIRDVSAVTAACMMVKRNVFEEIGKFNEQLSIGFGDIDFCLRARERGYHNIFTPYAVLYHHESATRGQSGTKDPHLEDTLYFIKRWCKEIIAGDPYYNPNLPRFSYDITPYISRQPREQGIS